MVSLHNVGLFAPSAARIAGLSLLAVGFWAGTAGAATYEVGPGKTYANILDAPLGSLQPGDEVLVYWRAEPYRETFGIDRAGTQAAPIIFRGVAGPGGELPVIDGENSQSGYEAHNRGLVHVAGDAAYLVFENFELRNANSDAGFPHNAASVFAPGGSHLTFRNLDIHHSGNGFFSWVDSSDVLVEGCYIHDNGNVDSIYEHNIYTESNGITFQFNRILPLRSGAGGNNLKDRSAGTVVRYNWIEGGNRVLDLVEAEDGDWDHVDDPAHVYGNVLIKHRDTNQSQIVHFGQDNGLAPRRLMFFYHNTVISDRDDRATIFFVNSDTRVEAYNNVFYSSGGGLEILDPDQSSGANLTLAGNWISNGWIAGSNSATTVGYDTLLEGSDPGLAADYRLATGSPQINAGQALPSGYDAVSSEYAGQGLARPRTDNGAPDIGAYALDSMGGGSPTGGVGGGGGQGGSAQGGSAQGGAAQGGSGATSGSGGASGSAQGGAGATSGSGGASGSGAAASGGAAGGSDDSGCGCKLSDDPQQAPFSSALAALAVGCAAWIRRRRGALGRRVG